jgi:hypothetical protein
MLPPSPARGKRGMWTRLAPLVFAAIAGPVSLVLAEGERKTVVGEEDIWVHCVVVSAQEGKKGEGLFADDRRGHLVLDKGREDGVAAGESVDLVGGPGILCWVEECEPKSARCVIWDGENVARFTGQLVRTRRTNPFEGGREDLDDSAYSKFVGRSIREYSPEDLKDRRTLWITGQCVSCGASFSYRGRNNRLSWLEKYFPEAG